MRTQLSQDEFLKYLAQMSASGYKLFGLYADDQLVAVAGGDVLVNLYYGRHLWVYDLVTDDDHRSKGYGKELLEYLISWATERGCEKVALSSGLQRMDAHRFYDDQIGMDRASYVFTMELE